MKPLSMKTLSVGTVFVYLTAPLLIKLTDWNIVLMACSAVAIMGIIMRVIE